MSDDQNPWKDFIDGLEMPPEGIPAERHPEILQRFEEETRETLEALRPMIGDGGLTKLEQNAAEALAMLHAYYRMPDSMDDDINRVGSNRRGALAWLGYMTQVRLCEDLVKAVEGRSTSSKLIMTAVIADVIAEYVSEFSRFIFALGVYSAYVEGRDE